MENNKEYEEMIRVKTEQLADSVYKYIEELSATLPDELGVDGIIERIFATQFHLVQLYKGFVETLEYDDVQKFEYKQGVLRSLDNILKGEFFGEENN